MKKILIILIIVLFLLITLIFLKNINFKKEEITLAEIKEKLSDITEIYVCNYNENISKPCRGSQIVKIVNDEEIISEFIKITVTLEEYKESVNQIGCKYTLYFINKNDSVVAAADFGYHYIMKTFDDRYLLNPSSNARLRELLGLEQW